MGAPAVIAVPSKAYVAINSYKSTRSLPSTLCDLGRVSNIAAAVILPRTRTRTSNFGNRNSVVQSIRSLPHKKRPISEVMDYSNSRPESASKDISTTNAVIESHKKRRNTISSQSSSSSFETTSVGKTNLDRNHDSNPETKIMKMKLIETCTKPSMVSIPDLSAVKDKKTHSISHHQTTQRNQNTPQALFLQQDQLRSLEAGTHSHLQRNQHVNSHGANIPQLPNQHNSQQVSRHHLLSMQLQQQNQQLRNENMQLQKQLSLFRQLIKNPQRLNQVLTRVEQRAH